MKKWFIPGVTAIAALAIIGVAFGQQGTPTPTSSSGTPASGTPSSGSASVQQFHADLKPLNDSGVSGTVAISVVNGQLGAQVQAQGLTPGQMHEQNIHQMSSGSATCPTSGSSAGSSSRTPSSGASVTSASATATSTSGTPSASGTSSSANIITATQGESSYGPAVMALTQQQFPVATGSGQILYANVFQNANVSSSASGTPSASGTTPSGTTTPSAGITSSGTPTPATSSAVTPPAGGSVPGGVSTPGAATTPSSGQPLTLTKDVVVLQGMVVNGTFDPTVPVACGEIQQGAASGALATPVAGQTPGAGVGGTATTPSASGTASPSETAGAGSMTPSSSGTSSSRTPVETPTP